MRHPFTIRMSAKAAIPLFLCFAVLIVGQAVAQSPGGRPAISHEFVYHSATKLTSVNLAGTFNKWDMKGDPMVSDPGGKVWHATLRLPAGKYEYKFVLDGKTWMADPTAKAEGTYGNSVLVLGGKAGKA